MAEERVDIVVVDRIAPTIVHKLRAMAKASGAAATGLGQVRTATTGMRSSTAQATRATDGLGKSLDKTKHSAISLGAVLRTLFMAYFAAAAAQRILTIADSYTEMTNKLNVVTDSAAETSAAMEELYDTAQESRASLDAAVQLYQRLSLAMSQTGATAKEVANVVRTVNMALLVGGADTQEATAAIRQLSQAFNKGKADGDEFRSMMENAPILMDMVAKELDVTRHALLDMAEEGTITAEVMFNAFSDVESVQRQMNEVTLTLGHSLTMLTNAFQKYFGELNRAAGATTALAHAIATVATNLNVVIPLFIAATGALIALKYAAVGELIVGLGLLQAAFTATAAAGVEFYNITAGTDYDLDDAVNAIRGWAHDVAGFFKSAVESLKGDVASTSEMTKTLIQQVEEWHAKRKQLRLVQMYGEERAAVIEWTRAHAVKAATLEESLASTEAAATVQRFLNEAEKQGIVISDLLVKAMERVAAQEDANKAITASRIAQYQKVGGEVERLELAVQSLSELYEATGTEMYKRLLEDAEAALAEFRKTQNMTAEDLKVYRAEVARLTENERIRQDILSRTSGAVEQAKAGIRMVTSLLEEERITLRQAMILWKEYQLAKKAAMGYSTDAPKTPPEGRPEETFQDRLDEAYLQSYERTYERMAIGTAQLRAEMSALNRLMAEGAISAELYANQMASAELDVLRFSIAAGEADMKTASLKMTLLKLISEMPEPMEAMADIFVGAFDRMRHSIGDAVAELIVFQEKFKMVDLFREVVAQMISQLIALTAQYIIVGLARQFAGFGAPEVQSFDSPAAHAGYYGPGFASGGYTGGGSASQPAGIVHGQEFVVNARATAQHRGLLESVNAGKSVMPNVIINNNAPGVTVRAEAVSEDEVRLIAEETVSRQAGQAVARDIVNPNSPVSRSLRRSTTAGRKGA